ncbi:hypothetical protein [Tautonia sociabilis]|uniref:Uncharacterized protein n=1 Tax=Tautonia sociabilis TaxID=2080755 RepID=A0A432MFY8_9BACT|nr:hypothetical protein [Tautonia sociabilis]RUL85375.1 hypothetical protein TsocGM_18540 [Tautonia sociabilis]
MTDSTSRDHQTAPDTGGGPPPAPEGHGDGPGPRPDPGAPRGLLAWTLGLATLAGLVTAIGVELSYASAKSDLREGPFNPKFEGNEPPGYEQMGNYEKRDAIVEFELRTKPPAEVKNSALANGLLGALLGAAMGLGAGLSRRSAPLGLKAAAVGLVVGGVAGAGASAVMGPVFFRFLTPESGLGLPLMTHGVIWAMVGLAGGLALGIGLGGGARLPSALVGGLIGGIVGTFVFEVINAIAFSDVRVYEPHPTAAGPRISACLSVAICVALFAVLALRERPKPTTPAHPMAD